MAIRICAWVGIALLVMGSAPALAQETVELYGVQLAKEKVVAGKTLKLNGVACRKAAMGFVKVYVVGLYLEEPTHEGNVVITSEQVKQLYFHYLTSKATAKKLQKGFIDLIRECNTPEMFERNQKDVERYASWFDKDMQPGLTSVTTYVPGKGLTMEYQGQERGTIQNQEFIEMYFRYNFGEKAITKIRDGLLGK